MAVKNPQLHRIQRDIWLTDHIERRGVLWVRWKRERERKKIFLGNHNSLPPVLVSMCTLDSSQGPDRGSDFRPPRCTCLLRDVCRENVPQSLRGLGYFITFQGETDIETKTSGRVDSEGVDLVYPAVSKAISNQICFWHIPSSILRRMRAIMFWGGYSQHVEDRQDVLPPKA